MRFSNLRKRLSEIIFPNRPRNDPKALRMISSSFNELSGYSPTYTSQQGGIYELSLCRACIHRKASESSKVTPALTAHNKHFEYIVSKQPNPWMTASQFYYRVRTILEVENNAFIVPIEDEFGRITGLYPVVPSTAEMKWHSDKLYLLYQFGDGTDAAIEYERCGHLKKHQYRSDFFGSSNSAFDNISNLIEAQEKGSASAIANGSRLRFIGKLNSQIMDEEDMKEQQNSLSMVNLKDNESGFFLYDNRWESMEPIDQKPVLLDADQKKAIDNSAYTYWGVNESILQNSYDEDTWNAFYESEIEPFFIQLGEQLTKMLYTPGQIMNGNEVVLTSDRLQYASNTTKVQVAKEGFDRGMLTINDARRILNMAPIDDPLADIRYIRSEYVPSDDIGKESEQNAGTENSRFEPDGQSADKTGRQ